MEVKRFGLGLRFDIMAGEEGHATPSQLWEEIFSVLTVSDVKGFHVFGGMASPEGFSSQDPCYFCVFTNGGLKQMRRVYRKLEEDAGIGMYLAATHSFLQHNALERLEGLTHYGKIQGDGTLAGGDEPLYDIVIGKKRGRRKLPGKGIVLLLAPDSFRFLSSKQAIRRLTLAARKEIPGVRILPLPIVGGGEGTVDALLTAFNGIGRSVQIQGPRGGKHTARYAVLDGDTAVIEMPAAFAPCGGDVSALYSSFGIGELIRRALDEGLNEIMLGLTPGCINDGGLGCLRALGVKLLDREGAELTEQDFESAGLAKIDVELLHPRVRETRFIIMTDHTDPFREEALYAPLRAGYAYAIQEAVDFDVAAPAGTDAAGGLGAAMMAFLGAACMRSIDALLAVAEFERRIRNVSLVVTGEGRLHAPSLRTDATVGAIISRCGKHKVPAAVLAEHIEGEAEALLEKQDCAAMLIDGAQQACNVEELVARFDTAAERMFRLVRMGRELERVSMRKSRQ